MAENILGKWGFRFVQIKGLVPFGPNKGKIRKTFYKSSKIFFS